MMQEIGEEFDPQEPYTRRLSSILDEYPEGSQILREILQNSDDAKSTEQIFMLDHNTYPSNHLIDPILSNYKKFDLKLDRFQGPALLSKNNSMFDERDLRSLKKLANSEKRDQFNKIGVMGIGFNSIYHITDSPSFITGDKLVILDPHRWYFNGGIQFNFVQKNLAEKFPDSFAPFRIPPFSIPCDEPFKGTLFRYPLRNDTISDISKKTFKPKDILEIFRKFYENESINCLLFLKYVERISFYELKEGATEPELLYSIQLENANSVREQRRLLAENIVPMMDLLKSKNLGCNSQLESSYIASFCRQKGSFKEDTVSWIILNYLNDLQETEEYFQKNFGKNIRNHKFIPNVGLAVPLNDLNILGRLFCFLPFPIHMPFPVSVHGYFAVSTNRRSLWSSQDDDELAVDALAHLMISWNQYLFENVLPKAWVRLLCELPHKVPNIRSDDVYQFWPIIKKGASSSVITFCQKLLQNVIKVLGVKDRVFKGPSLSNTIGKVPENLKNSYDASSFKESGFHWLSLSIGYLKDNLHLEDMSNLLKIFGDVGFPIISVLNEIIDALNNSIHKDFLKVLSPAIGRIYLKHNRDTWQDQLSKEEAIALFKNNHGLRNRLRELSIDGWNLNIKILDAYAIADMIRFTLDPVNPFLEEMQISNHS
ncbi:8389_t:CDS:2, partial [Funneliformis caledonium]